MKKLITTEKSISVIEKLKNSYKVNFSRSKNVSNNNYINKIIKKNFINLVKNILNKIKQNENYLKNSVIEN